MKAKAALSASSTELELLSLLSEFARFLLAAGVSYEKFDGLAKRAYVQAASLEARFSNSKINKSAIAAMTGLTRTDVRGVVKGIRQSTEFESDRLEKLVTGWLTDPAYSSTGKRPKKLLVRGERGSFFKLAKKYGADIPPKALLRELQRQKMVEIEGDSVVLTDNAHRLPAQRQLRQLTTSLNRMLRASQDQGVSVQGIKILSADATYPELSRVGQALLKRRIEEMLKTFTTEIETIGESISHDLSVGQKEGSKISKATAVVTIN
jgi:Family of unknown function (DUF6502)